MTASVLAILVGALPSSSEASSLQDSAAPSAGFLGRSALEWAEDLHDPVAEVRIVAAWALGRIGPAAADAAPGLLRTLDDGIDGVSPLVRGPHARSEAIGALARIGEAALPVLADGLETGDRHARSGCALALLGIAPSAATESLPLRRVAQDADADAALAATLARLVHEPGFDVFSHEVQECIAGAVFRCGGGGDVGPLRLCVGVLARDGAHGAAIANGFLVSPFTRVRAIAASALLELDPKHERARAAIETLVDGPDRELAALANGVLSEGVDPLPDPQQIVDSSLIRPERLAAARALLEIDPDHAEAGAVVLDELERCRHGDVPTWPVPPGESAALDDAIGEWRGAILEFDLVTRSESAIRLDRADRALRAFGPAAVVRLLALLDDPERKARRFVAERLLELAPHDPRPHDALVALLADPGVGDLARSTLASYGGRRAKLAALRRRLATGSERARLHVARLLEQIEPRTMDAIEALLELVGSGSDEIRDEASRELKQALSREGGAEIGARLEAWFRDERIPDAARLCMAERWSERDAGARAREPRLRTAIAAFLGARCAAEDLSLRLSCARVLVRIEPSSRAALEALVGLLRFDVGDFRHLALHEIQRASDDLLPLLVRVALDPSESQDTRSWAAYSVSARSGLAVHAMRKLLRDGDDEVRYWTVEGVWHWEFGENARAQSILDAGRTPGERHADRSMRAEAIELIEPLLEAPERRMRLSAAHALLLLDRSGVTWERAIDMAVLILDSCGDEDREHCVKKLGLIGDAIDQGESAFGETSTPEIRERGRAALGDRLMKRIRDPHRLWSNRTDCARALALSARMLDRLEKLLADGVRETALLAVWALRFVVDQEEAAGELLVRMLGHADPWMRLNAAQSLIAGARELDRARDSLLALASHDDENLRQAAAAELKALDGGS